MRELGLKNTFWYQFMYTNFLQVSVQQNLSRTQVTTQTTLCSQFINTPPFVLIRNYYLLKPRMRYSWALFLLFVMFPVHLFKALHNFHKQRFMIALLNFWLINIAFLQLAVFLYF